MQRAWIGRSEGAEITFNIDGRKEVRHTEQACRPKKRPVSLWNFAQTKPPNIRQHYGLYPLGYLWIVIKPWAVAA